MDTKRCAKCHDVKPHDEFSRAKHSPDGLQSYCKPCSRAYSRDNYAAHKERQLRRSVEAQR